MTEKEFKSYSQQIDLLKKKNLEIDNEEEAVSLLKRYSYFGLINGYKYPFKAKDGNYKNNTTIEDIYALYCFDNELRHVLLKYILEVENHIKSLLSYSFCEKYGEDESEYLNESNYAVCQSPKEESEVKKLINVLKDTLSDYRRYDYMYHQKKNHSNIPLWVLVKALTFGNISKMYSYQKSEIQARISKEFDFVRENNLVTFLDILTGFRNVCAHNERLFDYKVKKHQISKMPLHQVMKVANTGTRDLFAVIIVLKYLLKKELFENLVRDIERLITELFEKTNQIQRTQLYKCMGFPEDWSRIKNVDLADIKVSKIIYDEKGEV
ncbi:MAG: Abi family protein [Clostridia bacterium]|nr:Abi family protein [Clostridia bacterium]